MYRSDVDFAAMDVRGVGEVKTAPLYLVQAQSLSRGTATSCKPRELL